MKKIGIVTLSSNDNYGNKLQNYAIVKILTEKGYNVETVWNDVFLGHGIILYIKKTIKRIIRLSELFDKRKKCFRRFNRYLNYKHYSYSNNSLKRISKQYDAMIVGSDQVWNYEYIDGTNTSFLLGDIQKPKIAFSASFGVSNIPDNKKWIYKKYLPKFNSISVREDRGKELVKELAKRDDAEVLVDPTMLLDGKEWDVILRKPAGVPKKYILCYFLGEISEKRRKVIDEAAKEMGCAIINILDKQSPFYKTGPSEFLYLEKNAELICTDSFHSSVFAIIYNKPFVVFDREQKGVGCMNSRLETLLKKFHLENHKYSGDYMSKETPYKEHDEVYLLLERERKKYNCYIDNALGRI